MSWVNEFILAIRQERTPFYRNLKRLIKAVRHFTIPVPGVIGLLYRTSYLFFSTIEEGGRWLIATFYRSPVFRSLCVKSGARLSLEQIPYITGNLQIYLGDDVNLSGSISMGASRVYEKPELRIGNRVFVGHGATFTVAQRVEIGDGVWIAGGTVITDTDAHPTSYEKRIAGELPAPEEVKPVRIERNAWIGRNAQILKGVTIGEGAIVGAGSVVFSDVPAFGTAMGNPARVIRVARPGSAE